MTAFPLSVLDLAPVATGTANGAALRHTTALAQRVEQLGYRRFWVAEHHNMPGIASSAPAVLLAHLAASTSTIRLGSGGVMLPNHAPLVVAEQFGTLVALHPDRIDLGIGRAPGTDQVTALALRRSVDALSAQDFPQELARLVDYFTSTSEHARVVAVPGRGDTPGIWLLGSSDFSARLAGQLGLPFSYAHHFSSGGTDAALAVYRSSFQPSQWLAEPYAMVAVSAVCAETDAEAEWLSGPAVLAFLRLRQGRPGQMPTPEEAAAYPYTPMEREFALQRREGQALGSPETVTRQLNDLLKRTAADELMLTTLVYDINARIRSYELIADQVAPTLTRPH
ncbi:luciferase family oxidoreductase group 1 [Allocatelliglobosispora scoriae]|uniref:Luciferase family oxidoreductase group 1 n=1 Tax=Allocatelliglobosispora scoriae TaxID=643052 RepID=A0A841BPT4_9ACTN|nr:LLM class flavin-dependent oxidoreductase [Allocatelliglobosispora scoriae]MBB5868830.1 luciferase family oxidoreductase group 1 [Allocatelliglobosispora scoriae]